MNPRYFFSRDGTIKVLRLIFEMIAFASIASVNDHIFLSRLRYSVIILVTSFILDVIWITLHVTSNDDKINTDLNRLNLYIAGFMIILVLAAFVCVTVLAVEPALKNGAAFSFFTLSFWILDGYFCIKDLE